MKSDRITLRVIPSTLMRYYKLRDYNAIISNDMAALAQESCSVEYLNNRMER